MNSGTDCAAYLVTSARERHQNNIILYQDDARGRFQGRTGDHLVLRNPVRLLVQRALEFFLHERVRM